MKQISEQVKKDAQLDGSINKLRSDISKLTKEYYALSEADRKAAKGMKLAEQVRDMQTEVNKAEQDLLNFRSNVGNYASALSPLSFQVQQVARELPSLTMSAQQFFLAISNNLPMLADELKRASINNKALRAEGKMTIPVFRQVISSIFSWQTALVVGITLLTAFGKEIGAWAKGLFSADNALSATVQHTQELNRAIENSRSELKREFDALREVKKGTAEYAAARKVIEDKYGDYLSNQREEIRNLEDQKAAYDALAGSITAAAIAKGLEESNANAAEEYGEAMDKAFEGVQDKFVKKFGREAGIAYFTEFRAGLNSEIPELKKRAQEIYALFEDAPDGMDIIGTWREIFTGQKIGSTLYNELESTLNKVQGATDQYNETFSANKIAMKTLMDMYKISADDIDGQKEAIKDLIKQKEQELADINKEIATTEDEVISRNKRAEAVENEIKRLRELGRTNEKAAKARAAAIKKAAEEEKKARIKAAEDAHKELVAIWDQEQADEAARIGGLEIALAKKEEEYRNRLLKAQTQGGDTSAQKEMIRIAQEQVNILQDQLQDVEAFKGAYEAMGLSGIEIDNKRLEALKALQDAQKALQNTQNKAAEDEAKAQERSTAMSIQSAQQLAGALGGLAEAAGADAGVVAMLAIAESAAAMGTALHKAFSRSATVWDGIAGAVAAIATITTIVSQIKSLNSSAEEERSKYRYASGGLVTGPGTGTSDSIPARLSNGEAVMTAQAVNDWGAMLSAMNVASGGNAISVSNLPQRNDGMRGMKAMIREAMLEMPAPVVSVVDINKGQKRVKVQNSLGKLGRKKYQ